MILKCPTCGEQYEVQANKELSDFTMKCATCGTEISEQDEIIKITRLKRDTEGIGPIIKTKLTWKWGMAFMVALLVVMFFTKPKKAKHVKKVSETTMGFLSDYAHSHNEAFSRGLDMLAFPIVIDLSLGLVLQIDDYIFFNVGHIGDKTLTLGVFNCVFLLDDPKKEKEH